MKFKNLRYLYQSFRSHQIILTVSVLVQWFESFKKRRDADTMEETVTAVEFQSSKNPALQLVKFV